MNISKLQSVAIKAEAKHMDAQRKLKKAQDAQRLRDDVAAHKSERRFEKAMRIVEQFNLRCIYIDRVCPSTGSKAAANRLTSLPDVYAAIAVLMEDGRYINIATAAFNKATQL